MGSWRFKPPEGVHYHASKIRVITRGFIIANHDSSFSITFVANSKLSRTIMMNHFVHPMDAFPNHELHLMKPYE